MEAGALTLVRAVGVLPRDEQLRRALQVDADEDFFTVAPAGLSEVPPQDYQSFCSSSPFADGLPGGVKIVPFGLPSELPGLQSLAVTLSCYLGGLDVAVQTVRGGDVRSMRLFRRAADRLLAADLLDTLTRQLPAASSSVVLGVTMEPLVGLDGCSPVRYAKADGAHTAILSLHAFGPAKTAMCAHPSTELVLTVIQTCLQMLGFGVCGFASCVMNPWSNTARPPPLPLCPVCLRKLSLVVGVGATLCVGGSALGGQPFDVVKRYMRLAARCRELGIEQYVRWYEERVMAITQTSWSVAEIGASDATCALESPAAGGSRLASTQPPGDVGMAGACDTGAEQCGGVSDQSGDGKTAQLRLLRSRRRGTGRGSTDRPPRHAGGATAESTSYS